MGTSRDWAFRAADGAVLDALAASTHVGTLREYFGAAAYLELKELAAAARRARTRATPRVLILPGMMGSRMGGDVGARSPRNVWIDPARIGAGALTELRLKPGKALTVNGVLLFAYAKMMLRLKADGWDAAFFPYDWRQGLDALGGALAARIAADGRPVILIAHSMGGLVARVAAACLPKRAVRKLILLGTPNGGTFAPLQALRGTYPFVRWLARLDGRHSSRFLSEKVFGSFPGLYQLLPMQRGFGRIDLSNPHCWPKDAPRPDPILLTQACSVVRALPKADSRMIQIIGVNQETIAGVRRTARGFEYAMNLNGDGTVTVASALLPGTKAYFVDELHGNLANNAAVIQAVIDLLRRGHTRELSRHWRERRARPRRIDDAQLRMGRLRKIDWLRLDPEQREAVLKELDAGRSRAPTL
jgi:pimeloyl-ACP methyl ester carboxylesterase